MVRDCWTLVPAHCPLIRAVISPYVCCLLSVRDGILSRVFRRRFQRSDCGKAEVWLQQGAQPARPGSAAAAPAASPGGFPGFSTGFTHSTGQPQHQQQQTPMRDLFGSGQPMGGGYAAAGTGGGVALFGQATPYAQQATPQLGRGATAAGAAALSAMSLQPPTSPHGYDVRTRCAVHLKAYCIEGTWKVLMSEEPRAYM